MPKNPSISSQSISPVLKKRGKALTWLWLSLLVIVFDQMTKVWISHVLILDQRIAILPFFNLTLLHNTGAAFSFLAAAGGWQRWFLTGLALCVSIIIIIWLNQLKQTQRWLACALALILGGAAGNLIDRILYGHVVDFIQLYYQHWYWPAFNVADSAISVGAVMLLLDALWGNQSAQ
jgi:signal peptidase II